jgi:hypothetical protein
MRRWLLLLALVHAASSTSQAQASRIPVQLGTRISPDTVTVGQRFIAVIRVRAPRGASIEFPSEADSQVTKDPLATQMIGKPAVDTLPDSSALLVSAAYRLAAWDTGPQQLGIGNIVVRLGADTGYVSLAGRTVFVRSVLPEDSALRIPRPPRAAIAIEPFDWIPLAIAAAVIAVAALLWRLWIWYRRRRSAPLSPFEAARREFDRIESLRLVETGESARHAALMSDVMREYLAARVPGIERSHTSSELLAHAVGIHGVAPRLGELLWRTDLIKFANDPVSPEDAAKLGASSRETVNAVEQHLLGEERKPLEKAA